LTVDITITDEKTGNVYEKLGDEIPKKTV